MASIADNIKAIRQMYGLTQSELGKIAGVSDKAVSTWEAGQKEPRMGPIQRISDHFGILKSVIIDGDVTKQKGPSAEAESPYIDETIQLLSSLPEEDQAAWYHRLKAMIEADQKNSHE